MGLHGHRGFSEITEYTERQRLDETFVHRLGQHIPQPKAPPPLARLASLGGYVRKADAIAGVASCPLQRTESAILGRCEFVPSTTAASLPPFRHIYFTNEIWSAPHHSLIFLRGGRGGDEGLARTRGGYLHKTWRNRGKNEVRPTASPPIKSPDTGSCNGSPKHSSKERCTLSVQPSGLSSRALPTALCCISLAL